MQSLFAPRLIDSLASLALLLVRLVAGFAFILHGYGKIQQPFSWMGPEAPVPGIFQFLAAFSEFFGGIAWMVGLLTPLASLGLLSTMTVAVATHMAKGDPFVGKVSYELAAIYWTISLLLMLAGAGRWSLDALLFKRKV